MKITRNVICTLAIGAACAGLTTSASAFGLSNLTAAVPGMGGQGASGSAVTGGNIDTFVKTAHDADQLITTSTQYMLNVVADQDVIEAQKAKRDAANAIADPKERDAAIAKIDADNATIVQKALDSDKVQAKISSMNKHQLHQFGNAAFSFMVGVLKDKQLADESSSLVSGVAANPTLLPRLSSLKDVVSSVSSQASNSAKIADGLVKLAQSGKISKLPTSASDTPKQMDSMTE